MAEFYIEVFRLILSSSFDLCWILFFNFNGKFELSSNLNWWNAPKDRPGISLNSSSGYKILTNCLRSSENLLFWWTMNFLCCMSAAPRKILSSVYPKLPTIWLCLATVSSVIFPPASLRESMEKIIHINKAANTYLN